MALRKKGNVYYVYFRDMDGRQVCRSLKTHEKATALELHAQYMSRMRAAKGARVLAVPWIILLRRLRRKDAAQPPAVE